jgi:hypothetical protein
MTPLRNRRLELDRRRGRIIQGPTLVRAEPYMPAHVRGVLQTPQGNRVEFRMVWATGVVSGTWTHIVKAQNNPLREGEALGRDLASAIGNAIKHQMGWWKLHGGGLPEPQRDGAARERQPGGNPRPGAHVGRARDAFAHRAAGG